MLDADRYHGSIAHNYDADRRGKQLWKDEIETLDYYANNVLGLNKNKTLLDIPVGTGRFFDIYKKIGLNVIGMDVSQDMINESKKLKSGYDLRIGDVRDIDLPDKSVDVSICIRLLNLMEPDSMVKGMKELDRVTVRDMVISMRTGPSIQRFDKSITHDERLFESLLQRFNRTVITHRILQRSGYGLFVLRKQT